MWLLQPTTKIACAMDHEARAICPIHGTVVEQDTVEAGHVLGRQLARAGHNLLSLFIHETMAAVSLLQAMDEADADRIGITGSSGRRRATRASGSWHPHAPCTAAATVR